MTTGDDDDLVSRLGRLDPAAGADPARLLGMVISLAGELFVVKAQLERLTRAACAAGIGTEQLMAAGETDDMKRWLQTEERGFTQAILAPFIEGDTSVNATAFMRED